MTNRADWLEHVIFKLDMYVPRVCITCATVIVLIHYAALAEGSDLDDLKVNRADLVNRPWSALTYAFVHGSHEHMWNNVGGLLTLGCWFEVLNGPMDTIIILLLSIPFGALGHVSVKTNNVKGFSGAVFAFLVCPMVLLALNFKEMPLAWFRLVLYIGLAIVTIIGAFTGSLAGHLGGAASGLLVAFVIGKNILLRRFEKWIALVAACLLQVIPLVVLLYLPEIWPLVLLISVVLCMFIYPVVFKIFRTPLASPVTALHTEHSSQIL